LRKTRETIETEYGASGAKLDALFGRRTGSKTSATYTHQRIARSSRSGPSRKRPGERREQTPVWRSRTRRKSEISGSSLGARTACGCLPGKVRAALKIPFAL
jgi:hypothetical protein